MNGSRTWRRFRLLLVASSVLFIALAMYLASSRTEAYRLAYNGRVTVHYGSQQDERPSLHNSLFEIIPETDEIAQEISYQLQLSLSDDQLKNYYAQSGNLYLELPPFWGKTVVYLDSKVLAPIETFTQSIVPSEIFSGKTYLLPRESLTPRLNITIVGSGQRNLVGFRSESIYLFLEQDVTWLRLTKFVQNGIHGIYGTISLFIGLFGFLMFRSFNNKRNGFVFLVFGSVAMIPYHMMSSQIWVFLTASPTLPFVVHIASQAVAIPFFILYSLYFGLNGSLPKGFGAPLRYLSSFALLWLTLMVAGQSLNFSIFMKLVQVWFVMLAISFFVTIFYIYKKKGQISAILIAGLLFLSNLITDLRFGSIYLLGHGAFAFSLIGLSLIISSHSKNARDLVTLFSLVAGFIPKSIVHKMRYMVQEGFSIEAIRHSLSGTKLVSIVFIDICGYRGLRLRLKPSEVDLLTSRLFQFSGRVFDRHGLELLKTMGDNIIFVGGLGASGKGSPQLVAESALAALSELMNRLPELDEELLALGLAPIQIKVSAAIGECNYYLKGTDHEFRFDLDGDPFIHAKHLEEGMNEQFYRKYGTNVVSISSSLFLACSQIQLLKLFHESETFYDKNAAPMEGMVLSKLRPFNQEVFGKLLAKHPSFHQLNEEDLEEELLAGLTAISKSLGFPNAG